MTTAGRHSCSARTKGLRSETRRSLIMPSRVVAFTRRAPDHLTWTVRSAPTRPVGQTPKLSPMIPMNVLVMLKMSSPEMTHIARTPGTGH